MRPTTQTRPDSRLDAPVGSATQTVFGTSRGSPVSSTLRLRGEDQTVQEPQRRLRWAEDVVNNEGMGKKKSKVCCIYHKPHDAGESSSEDSSDGSSDSDSDGDDDGSARPSRGRQHDHKEHHDDCNHGHGSGHSSQKKKQRRKASPNAYEKQPKYAPKSASQA